MHDLPSRILEHIRSTGLTFPGLDDQAVLDRVVPVAQEWVLMQIVTHHMSVDDQTLFRDSYISAPDIFDPVEYCEDILPDFYTLTE